MSISRRTFLETLGAGVLLGLTTCNPARNPPFGQELPDIAPAAAGPVPGPEDESIYAPPPTAKNLPHPPAPPASSPAGTQQTRGKDVIMPAETPKTAPIKPARPEPTSPAIAAADGIIPRSAWTRQPPILSRVEPMNGVNLITFHHSGDREPFYGESLAETIEHLELTRAYHTTPRAKGGAGMCDIGYHFAIDRQGRIWQLRPTRYQGEHVRDNNPHNIGVVLMGNFELQRPTQAQLDRALKFGRQLRQQYDLPIKRIFTHRELKATICPGKYAQPYFDRIRKQKLI